jgi:hypothetical protein
MSTYRTYVTIDISVIEEKLPENVAPFWDSISEGNKGAFIQNFITQFVRVANVNGKWAFLTVEEMSEPLLLEEVTDGS